MLFPKKIGRIYFHGSRKFNKIALTFDDGPCKETEEILKVLKKEEIPATFFVLGKKLKKNPLFIKQIVKQGSEVGNHSYSHDSLLSKSSKKIIEEILQTDKLLLKQGIKTNLFRPPYSRFNLNLFGIAKKLNKFIIIADTFSDDWKMIKKEKIIKNVLKSVRKGSILSFHDYIEDFGRNLEIVEVLKALIPKLKEKGYKFVTVSDLLQF